MRALLIPILAVLAIGGNSCNFASAADMTPYPTKAAPVAITALPSWTGLYFGLYGGYGANLSDTTVTGATTLAGLSTQLGAAPRGPVLGGQIGYDWQAATDIVFGLRLDGSWANMTSGASVNAGPAQLLSISNATNWLMDVGARIGYSGLGNHVLPYVIGGFAVGGAKPDLMALAMPAVAASQTSTGWFAGGGVETKLTQKVSVFAEADIYDLGNKSLTATIGGLPLATSSTPFRFAVGEVGLNVRFP